jgi:hypothetical protein
MLLQTGAVGSRNCVYNTCCGTSMHSILQRLRVVPLPHAAAELCSTVAALLALDSTALCVVNTSVNLLGNGVGGTAATVDGR